VPLPWSGSEPPFGFSPPSSSSPLRDGPPRRLDAPPGVLAFARPPGFICVVNLSGSAVPLPAHDTVLLTSGGLDGGLLPPETAAWLSQYSTRE
jgi:alpha-glucosidase